MRSMRLGDTVDASISLLKNNKLVKVIPVEICINISSFWLVRTPFAHLS